MTTLMNEQTQDTNSGVNQAGNFVADFQEALETIGEQYGIYEAMSQTGPVTPAELAGFTGLAKSTVQAWLNSQAVGGYIHFSQPADRYCLWCSVRTNRH